MAQLGRLKVTVTKTNGQAVGGASVHVRQQGATIQSGGPNAFTVDDPGSFVAGNVAFLGTSSTPRSVTSVGATIINLGSTGFVGTSNNDRLSNNSLPALYLDVQGNQSTANPMTTDSTGQVSVWTEIRPLDLHVSGSGITAELRQDVVPEGHERVTSNVHDGVTAIAYISDTERALIDVNAIHTSYRVGAVEIAKLMADGEIVFDIATIASGATITTGGLTVAAGGTTITGNSTITGTLGSLTGLTVDSGGAAVTGNSTITGTLKATKEILAADVGTIASPGGAELTLTDGNVFSITGTNAITSIAAASSTNGRIIFLKFTGALTFTNGNNLKLTGNFSTGANDTITLACDGTDWYEMSRSDNA